MFLRDDSSCPGRSLPSAHANNATLAHDRHRVRTVTTHLLTKSDFKVACGCSAKLYYRKLRYPDTNSDDPYLALLAEGGFMLEHFARARHPEGIHFPAARRASDAWAATEAAIAVDGTWFEATLLSGRLVARIDILRREGNRFDLFEVKSKLWDSVADAELRATGKPGLCWGKSGKMITGDWTPYLLDVAFQAHVLGALYPEMAVVPWLVMPDLAKRTTTEGLHHHFTVSREGERAGTRFDGDPALLAAENLLTAVDVSREVAMMRETVRTAAEHFAASLDPEPRFLRAKLSRACAACEYRVPNDVQPNGFAECWGELATPDPHVLDLYRAPPDIVDDAIASRRTALLDVLPDRLVKKDGTIGVHGLRQRVQLAATRTGTPWCGDGLAPAIAAWAYPLHFIDFETTRVVVPYHQQSEPYAQVCFQWSCHTVAAAGAAPAHREWINTTDFHPNVEFAETLRDAVGDDGTVLMWASHERTAIREIRDHVGASSSLGAWLDQLAGEREGSRLVDMHALCEREYFHPAMRGRTSLKRVLDAVWRDDAALRHEWPQYAGRSGEVRDLYETLPPLVIAGVEQAVREGTGAVRAYHGMLYGSEKHDAEARDAWRRLLLQYCELDTLAMVMVWRHWRRAAGLDRAAPG